MQVAVVGNTGVATYPELGPVELAPHWGGTMGSRCPCCYLLRVPVRRSSPASILPVSSGIVSGLESPTSSLTREEHPRRAQCELFHRGLPKIWMGGGQNAVTAHLSGKLTAGGHVSALRADEVFITFIGNACVMFRVPAGRN